MNLKSMIERSRKLFKNFSLNETKIEQIENILFENTFKNFVDPEFPPSDESIFR